MSGVGGASGALALGGLGGSAEPKDCDLLCPVCFELIEEAYVTRCGHSFCYACIAKSVELHRRCPKCGAALASRDHIFPNFLLNELVAKRRSGGAGALGPESGVGGGAARVPEGSSAGGGPGGPPGGPGSSLRAALAREARRLPLPDVDLMLQMLTKRKRALEAVSTAAQQRLLLEFLSQLHRQRTRQLGQLAREAALVAKDMEHVAGTLRELSAPAPAPAEAGGAGDAGAGAGAGSGHSGGHSGGREGDALMDAALGDDDARTHSLASVSTSQQCESFAGAGVVGVVGASGSGGGVGGSGVGVGADDALSARWRRLQDHFDDFVQCYFAHRADELYFPPACEGDGTPPATPHPSLSHAVLPSHSHSAAVAIHTPGDARVPVAGDTLPASSASTVAGGWAGCDGCGPESYPTSRASGLAAFGRDLAAFSRYKGARALATLHYCSDAINYSTIVSTIEFDKDDEFFAIAGVTKRIKVFELAAVVGDAVDVHYPCAEMQCAHKVSSVSWNKYHKGVLASADYEGTVSVWDAHTGQRTRALQEHDKRCWSVHFNRCDVRLLASGSDDARVKLWALNADRAVHTLEAKFNVCCVRFNPRSSCHLAFGSADHCVHYYDLRAPRQPLAVFKDHRKAVSYVKFLDARTLVSASTDSQLKLWHVESPRCVRSFTGHTNEKNFVGLATDGQYIACGSENNALYVYYAGLAKPLLHYRFEAARGLLERERRDDEPAEFVSAVCWRRAPDRPLLLAANSQGTIKLLELL